MVNYASVTTPTYMRFAEECPEGPRTAWTKTTLNARWPLKRRPIRRESRVT